MISLALPEGPLSVLCLGAHPDDIEIGCGGALLTLVARADVLVTYLILTGSADRRAEAGHAAKLFWEEGATTPTMINLEFADGRLPSVWDKVKDALESVATEVQPDLIFAPRRDDLHQDHRLVAELVPTVWRNSLVLHYEIPKWDGDIGTVTHYVPLSVEQAANKVRLLNAAYPSQHHHDWWDDGTFFGLMRLRGVECRSTYAEGFAAMKTAMLLSPEG